jgi:hypothetical protein
MRAAEARGKHLGRPPTLQHIVSKVVALATSRQPRVTDAAWLLAAVAAMPQNPGFRWNTRLGK